jgi:hypothetical protein
VVDERRRWEVELLLRCCTLVSRARVDSWYEEYRESALVYVCSLLFNVLHDTVFRRTRCREDSSGALNVCAAQGWAIAWLALPKRLDWTVWSVLREYLVPKCKSQEIAIMQNVGVDWIDAAHIDTSYFESIGCRFSSILSSYCVGRPPRCYVAALRSVPLMVRANAHEGVA